MVLFQGDRDFYFALLGALDAITRAFGSTTRDYSKLWMPFLPALMVQFDAFGTIFGWHWAFPTMKSHSWVPPNLEIYAGVYTQVLPWMQGPRFLADCHICLSSRFCILNSIEDLLQFDIAVLTNTGKIHSSDAT